jgi:ferric-dicitrate binding protein FerR (iron transport regulator)
MEKLTADKQEYLSDIIAASLLDSLGDKGERELNEWLSESCRNKDFYESLKKSFLSGELASDISSCDSTVGWSLVKQKVARRRRKRIYRTRSLYAASIAGMLVLLSVLFIPASDRNSETLLSSEATPSNTIKDNYKALLVLPRGDMVDLGKEQEFADGKIKNNGTVLEYKTQSTEETTPEQPLIHMLRVPRGAEYKVVLSDGTAVHLNADSELRYPEQFADCERRVELDGEAWFEVAHNPHKPFVVQNGDMSLMVLGTKFDFRCYEGESRTATLTEGRLRVIKGEESVEIEPGSQAYETGNTLGMRTVNLEEQIAWLNKRFVYRASSLEYVMSDIARWYDVDVEFGDARAKEMRLTANIPRYENIESVLNIIRDAVYASITMDDGVISVSR